MHGDPDPFIMHLEPVPPSRSQTLFRLHASLASVGRLLVVHIAA